MEGEKKNQTSCLGVNSKQKKRESRTASGRRLFGSFLLFNFFFLPSSSLSKKNIFSSSLRGFPFFSTLYLGESCFVVLFFSFSRFLFESRDRRSPKKKKPFFQFTRIDRVRNLTFFQNFPSAWI